jgi:hypothetical protein
MDGSTRLRILCNPLRSHELPDELEMFLPGTLPEQPLLRLGNESISNP